MLTRSILIEVPDCQIVGARPAEEAMAVALAKVLLEVSA